MSIVLSLVVVNSTAGEVKSSLGLLKPCTSIEKYCFQLLRTSTLHTNWRNRWMLKIWQENRTEIFKTNIKKKKKVAGDVSCE